MLDGNPDPLCEIQGDFKAGGWGTSVSSYMSLMNKCHQPVGLGCWGKGTGHQNNRMQRLLSAFYFSCCPLPNAKGKVMPLFSILSRFIDPESGWIGFWSKGALYHLQAPTLLLPASFVPSIAFRFPQWFYYYTMEELFTIKRSSSGEIYPGLT